MPRSASRTSTQRSRPRSRRSRLPWRTPSGSFTVALGRPSSAGSPTSDSRLSYSGAPSGRSTPARYRASRSSSWRTSSARSLARSPPGVGGHDRRRRGDADRLRRRTQHRNRGGPAPPGDRAARTGDRRCDRLHDPPSSPRTDKTHRQRSRVPANRRARSVREPVSSANKLARSAARDGVQRSGV